MTNEQEIHDHDPFGHVIGLRHEDLRMLPDLSEPVLDPKLSRRLLSEAEKAALIDEPGIARNKAKLNLKNTHYETMDPSEIAMMILPLKGL